LAWTAMVRFSPMHCRWRKYHSNVNRALTVLHEQVPAQPGEPDPRSFEWYFLQRQCVGEKRTIAVHASPVTAVALSPDGRLLVTANSGPAPGDKPAPVEILFWDTGTGKRLFALTGHDKTVNCLAFNPAGDRLASASVDGTVKVWDVADTGRLR